VTATPEPLDAGETAPQALPVQLVPDSVQFTPLFAASFCNVAANVCVAPVATLAIDGATTTEIAAPAVSVIVAFADLLASSTDVAVSVTVGGFGSAAGAVYITAAPDAALLPDSEPQAAPVQPGPDSVHVVPSFFGSFKTVAVKLAPWLACTVALAGVSATATVGAGLVEDPPPHPASPATVIITHALIAATFARSTPRRKSIYPPGKAIGDGSGILSRAHFSAAAEEYAHDAIAGFRVKCWKLDARSPTTLAWVRRKPEDSSTRVVL
jgi:hypothetical protein